MTEAVEKNMNEKAPTPDNVGAQKKAVEQSVKTTKDRSKGVSVAPVLEPVSPMADLKAVDLFLMVIDAEDCAKMIKESAKQISAANTRLDERRVKDALWAVRKAFTAKPKAPWEVTPEPWPDSVQIGELVHELEGLIQEVMYCSPEVATATAYYCLASWFVDYTDYAPYFCITAATKKCGKSVLIDLMRLLVRRPYVMGSSAKAAHVYRLIEDFDVTLICDEVDTYLANDKELQGVLNCGINRNLALVTRCVKDRNDNQKVEPFKAFGFKVFAGIRADCVGEALMDRAIIVRLKRASASVKKSLLRVRDIESARSEMLCRKCSRLAEDLGPLIRRLKPEDRPAYPDGFDSRDCDKWELIFTLAQFVGVDELKRVKNVALKLKGDLPQSVDWTVELLSDCRKCIRRAEADGTKSGFNHGPSCDENERFSLGEGFITVAGLNNALKSDADMPWKTWGRRLEGLTTRDQTKALKGFGVESFDKKIGKGADSKVRKVYSLNALETAFKENLEPWEWSEAKAA